MKRHDVTLWVELVPSRWGYRRSLVGVRVGRTWKRKPADDVTSHPVVKIALAVDEALFDPVAVDLQVDAASRPVVGGAS